MLISTLRDRNLLLCSLATAFSISLAGCSDGFFSSQSSSLTSTSGKSVTSEVAEAAPTASPGGLIQTAAITFPTDAQVVDVVTTSAAPATASPNTATAASNDIKSVVAVDTSGANWLEVTSPGGAARTNVPFQFGRPFRPGEIRGCPVAVSGQAIVTSQSNVMTRHSDGSVKFAVISLLLASVSATPTRISFQDSATCPKAPTSTFNPIATFPSFDAGITIAGQRISARSMATSGLVAKTWLSGPVNTTIVYADHTAKSMDRGSDSASRVRPIFEVQFWHSINKYRVRYILENADTEKIGTELIAANLDIGTLKTPVANLGSFQLNHSSRLSQTAWSDASKGTDLDVNWNVGYLASTKAIPNYDASIAISTASVDALLASWKASDRSTVGAGLWTKFMPQTGGRMDLGPYPRWSVAMLFDGRAQVQEMANALADQAGAWPMHLREGNALKRMGRNSDGALNIGKVLSFYTRPTIARPGCNGYNFQDTSASDRVKYSSNLDAAGWDPDTAHMPQPYFLSYLLTGEHFYLEQLQFWGSFAASGCGPAGTSGVVNVASDVCWARSVYINYAGANGQVRGQAWSMRAIAEAGWASPDDDSLKQEYAMALEDKIVLEEARKGIVRGTNTTRPDWKWGNSAAGDCGFQLRNSMGVLKYWAAGDSYGGGTGYSVGFAPWQYSFMMYSLNRAWELGYPTDKLREWLGQFFVSSVTAPNANPYLLGRYVIPVLDLNGVAFDSWSAVNEVAKLASPVATSADWFGSGSVKSLDQGYGTVAIAAMASAYGLPSANTAWTQFAQDIYAKWGWNDDPKWAILPR